MYPNCRTYSLLQLASLIVQLTILFAQEDFNVTGCIERLKTSDPGFSARFSDDQTELICLKRAVWKQGAERTLRAGGRPGRPPGPPPRQSAFLSHVRGCRQIVDCLQPVGATTLGLPSATPAVVGLPGMPGPPPPKLYVYRKEYRTLTDEERKWFHDALNKLKSTYDPVAGNQYDALVADHNPEIALAAHGGSAFPPYHRELVKTYEIALRLIDERVASPFWDSSLDQKLPNPCHSVLFTDELMGNDNGIVDNGAVGHWRATQAFANENRLNIYRQCGRDPRGTGYKRADFEFFDSQTKYANLFASCVHGWFEGAHNVVHRLVGGHMGNIATSPNDPIFFMHHTFADCLWEDFRKRQPRKQREKDYPPDIEQEACGKEHFANASMAPFPDMKNIDGLSNDYTDSFYNYVPRPTCDNGWCYGRFLYCDKKSNECMSKIRPGGDCTGFEGTEICYKSKCVNSVCIN